MLLHGALGVAVGPPHLHRVRRRDAREVVGDAGGHGEGRRRAVQVVHAALDAHGRGAPRVRVGRARLRRRRRRRGRRQRGRRRVELHGVDAHVPRFRVRGRAVVLPSASNEHLAVVAQCHRATKPVFRVGAVEVAAHRRVRGAVPCKHVHAATRAVEAGRPDGQDTAVRAQGNRPAALERRLAVDVGASLTPPRERVVVRVDAHMTRARTTSVVSMSANGERLAVVAQRDPLHARHVPVRLAADVVVRRGVLLVPTGPVPLEHPHMTRIRVAIVGVAVRRRDGKHVATAAQGDPFAVNARVLLAPKRVARIRAQGPIARAIVPVKDAHVSQRLPVNVCVATSHRQHGAVVAEVHRVAEPVVRCCRSIFVDAVASWLPLLRIGVPLAHFRVLAVRSYGEHGAIGAERHPVAVFPTRRIAVQALPQGVPLGAVPRVRAHHPHGVVISIGTVVLVGAHRDDRAVGTRCHGHAKVGLCVVARKRRHRRVPRGG